VAAIGMSLLTLDSIQGVFDCIQGVVDNRGHARRDDSDGGCLLRRVCSFVVPDYARRRGNWRRWLDVDGVS